MGNEKNDWMIYSDREMSVLSAQEEKVSTLRHWISGDRECPVYTKRMLAYMVELKRLEAKRDEDGE